MAFEFVFYFKKDCWKKNNNMSVHIIRQAIQPNSGLKALWLGLWLPIGCIGAHQWVNMSIYYLSIILYYYKLVVTTKFIRFYYQKSVCQIKTSHSYRIRRPTAVSKGPPPPFLRTCVVTQEILLQCRSRVRIEALRFQVSNTLYYFLHDAKRKKVFCIAVK